MHAALNILAATTTTTAKHKSSSSIAPFLIIIVVFAAVYLLFLRPRQQRMRQQQTAARELSVGDQVVTAGGIQGRLVAIDANVAEVEIAPGVVVTMLRRAVSPSPDARKPSASPPAEDEWPMQRGQTADSGDDEKPDDKPDQRS
jgi:preprotein translocase subunit YajC